MSFRIAAPVSRPVEKACALTGALICAVSGFIVPPQRRVRSRKYQREALSMEPQIWTYLIPITLLTLTPGVDTVLIIRNTTLMGWSDH